MSNLTKEINSIDYQKYSEKEWTLTAEVLYQFYELIEYSNLKNKKKLNIFLVQVLLQMISKSELHTWSQSISEEINTNKELISAIITSRAYVKLFHWNISSKNRRWVLKKLTNDGYKYASYEVFQGDQNQLIELLIEMVNKWEKFFIPFDNTEIWKIMEANGWTKIYLDDWSEFKSINWKNQYYKFN